MYELTEDEISAVVSQNVIPSKRYFGGSSPFAFTENKVSMLSSVLNSKKAIEVNIAIMRTFTMLRHKNPAYRQAGMTKINAEGTACGESKRGTVAGTVEFCERGSLFFN